MIQESLLPDTDAIRAGTLEWTKYRGKHLVRYKDRAGYVHRCHTVSYEEANAAWDKWLAELQSEKGTQK